MKIQDIRDLSTQELEDKVKDLKEELFNLRFQNATNQLENPMRIVSVKKDIARVKTVLKEKELENLIFKHPELIMNDELRMMNCGINSQSLESIYF